MMASNRLQQLDSHLNKYREQLECKEEALRTIAPEERVRIKQQISSLKAEIRPFEEEYWQLLASNTDQNEFINVESIVVEIVDQSDKLLQSKDLSEEILAWVRQIHEKVSQPEVTAAAKLKGVISSIPPFVGISYEAELDTENFLRAHFPKFTKWVKVLAKK
jgi:chromosome segregation ATPase